MPVLELEEDGYAKHTLEACITDVRNARKGRRNETLLKAATQLGHLTGASRLDRSTVEARLLDAALSIGEERPKSLDTIKRSLDFGETEPLHRQAKKSAAEYVYTDEAGASLFKVIKSPDKRFTQKRFENGEWVYKLLPDTRRTLYHLPRVIAGVAKDEPIYIVEGEKDVATLEERGLYATTSPHGAGKWRDEYSTFLRGAVAVIIPDYDAPGLEHGLTVLRSLHRHDCSAVVALPAEEGMDATDHLESGRTIEQLEVLDEDALERRIAEMKTQQQSGIMSHAELMRMEIPEQSWVVDDLVAPGVTLLFSVPKGRKSFLCLDLAISVSTGRPMFDKYPVRQGNVLYLALEDSALRLRSRSEKVLAGLPPGSLDLFPVDSGQWGALDEDGAERILDWIKSVKDPRLVIIDVFEKVRGSRKGDSVYGTDYEAIRPLGEIAAETGVAVIVVHHTSKAMFNVDDPMSAASGSNGLRGSVDNLIFLRKKGDNGSLVLEGRDLNPNEIPLDWDQPNLRWRVSALDPEHAEFGVIVDVLDRFQVLSKSRLQAEMRMPLSESNALIERMLNRGLLRWDQHEKHYYLPPTPKSDQQSDTPDQEQESTFF